MKSGLNKHVAERRTSTHLTQNLSVSCRRKFTNEYFVLFLLPPIGTATPSYHIGGKVLLFVPVSRLQINVVCKCKLDRSLLMEMEV